MTKNQRRLWLSAYHEAGHAVAKYPLGFRIKKISIIPDYEEGNLGHVMGYKMSRAMRDFIETCGAFPDDGKPP